MLDEAAIMQAYLRREGIPASAIIADHDGRNTAATARNAAALLGRDTPMIAVAQWFHLLRTMLMLRRAGVGTVSGAWPVYAEWRDLYSFLREAIAIPVALLSPRDAAAARPR